MDAGDMGPKARVYAKSGNDRLSLTYTAGDCGDFESLLWERRIGTEWKVHRALSQQEFQSQHARRRWVINIHSLLPEEGTAIILVAEGDKPEPSSPTEWRCITFYWSWRLWNLDQNFEVRRLMDCESAIEPYVPDES